MLLKAYGNCVTANIKNEDQSTKILNNQRQKNVLMCNTKLIPTYPQWCEKPCVRYKTDLRSNQSKSVIILCKRNTQHE